MPIMYIVTQCNITEQVDGHCLLTESAVTAISDYFMSPIQEMYNTITQVMRDIQPQMLRAIFWEQTCKDSHAIEPRTRYTPLTHQYYYHL